jgi:glutaredoxin-like YruB-family protein
MREQQKRVILFSTPTCSWCRRTKDYFRKNRIRFREIDVSKDERAMRDVVRMTGQMGVPVVLIGNRPIVGFNKQEIDKLLQIRSM